MGVTEVRFAYAIGGQASAPKILGYVGRRQSSRATIFVAQMAQRLTSNTYGKAFLWLVAVAIALLVEGFLSQQSTIAAGGPAPRVEVEQPAEETGANATLRVERLAGAIVEVVQLFRTLR